MYFNRDKLHPHGIFLAFKVTEVTRQIQSFLWQDTK